MLSTVQHAALYAAVIGCAASLSLMLAPGWEIAGLIVMVASAMLAMVDVPGMHMRWAQIFFRHAGPLIPLALLAMLIVVHGVERGSIEGVEYYLAKYLGGIACFAAFFIVMSQARRDLRVDAILLAMIGALLAHLALFGVDLIIHLRGGASTGPALFALAPRVGRKMLSIALTCLLPFSVAGWHIFKEHAFWRVVCGTVSVLTLLALSVIDTRAALLSMLIAVMVFATSSIVRQGLRAAMVVIWASRGRIASLALVAISVMLLVFYSGAHRLERLSDSVASALHADSSQAWITQDAWVPEFCQKSSHGCSVDASIYLRLAWLKYGISKIAEHPLGIGVVTSPLMALLKADYPVAAQHTRYEEFHNELVNIAVCFGLPGLVLIVIFLFSVLKSSMFAWRRDEPDLWRVAMAFSVTALAIRMMIDTLSGGAWYVFLSLAGGLVGWSASATRRAGLAPFSMTQVLPSVSHQK